MNLERLNGATLRTTSGNFVVLIVVGAIDEKVDASGVSRADLMVRTVASNDLTEEDKREITEWVPKLVTTVCSGVLQAGELHNITDLRKAAANN